MRRVGYTQKEVSSDSLDLNYKFPFANRNHIGCHPVSGDGRGNACLLLFTEVIKTWLCRNNILFIW